MYDIIFYNNFAFCEAEISVYAVCGTTSETVIFYYITYNLIIKEFIRVVMAVPILIAIFHV